MSESDPNFDVSNDSIRSNLQKLLKVKNNLTKIYHEQFLAQLASQALDRGDRYKPVSHDPLKKGDLVFIKDSFSKPHTYPLGKVMKVYHNINNEVTNLEVLKGKSGEITKRHISSVIPFLKVDDSSDADSPEFPEMFPSCPLADRPQRLAAQSSRQKTRDILIHE